MSLFLDSDGLVCSYTSLANGISLPYDLKFPVLLPRVDHVIRLLIKHFHTSNGHAGVQQTLSAIGLQFWIPKLGKIVSQVIRTCGTVPHSVLLGKM